MFETRPNRAFPLRDILWNRLEQNLWFQVRNRLQSCPWDSYYKVGL